MEPAEQAVKVSAKFAAFKKVLLIMWQLYLAAKQDPTISVIRCDS